MLEAPGLGRSQISKNCKISVDFPALGKFPVTSLLCTSDSFFFSSASGDWAPVWSLESKENLRVPQRLWPGRVGDRWRTFWYVMKTGHRWLATEIKWISMHSQAGGIVPSGTHVTRLVCSACTGIWGIIWLLSGLSQVPVHWRAEIIITSTVFLGNHHKATLSWRGGGLCRAQTEHSPGPQAHTAHEQQVMILWKDKLMWAPSLRLPWVRNKPLCVSIWRDVFPV